MSCRVGEWFLIDAFGTACSLGQSSLERMRFGRRVSYGPPKDTGTKQSCHVLGYLKQTKVLARLRWAATYHW